jgi:anti-sigma factor RsiW
MNPCTGKPAELYAMAYVEGTLSEFDLGRFEEHFFACPECLAHVQAIEAARQVLLRQSAGSFAPARTRSLLAWRTHGWAWGAVAAALVIGFLLYHESGLRKSQPALATVAPAVGPKAVPAPQPAAAASEQASHLADLALPAFAAWGLRGESPEAHFDAGMKAYLKGDCRSAVAVLSDVPPAARESLAAQFYGAVCQMHLGKLSAAGAGLRKVVSAGDSPQQEAALYSLAQIALLDNDPASAHRYLVQTIGLRGDMERRARAQDRRVSGLIGGNTAKTQQNQSK